MQQFIPLIIFVAVAVLLVAIVRTAKRREEEFRQELLRLGYSPLEQFDPSLHEKLMQLLRKHANAIRFRNIYAYSRMNFTFYRFDINRGKEIYPAYAITARGVHLPRLAIIPKVNLPGLLGKMWKQMLKYATGGRNFVEVQLPENSPFTKKYVLFAEDPRAVERDVPPSAWEKLAALPQSLMLDATDDLVVFQEFAFNRKRKRAIDRYSLPELQAAMDLAGRIYDCLRTARHVPAEKIS